MGRGTTRIAAPLVALAGLSGCSQLPPQAAEHGRALTAYHDQTAAATLAAFDHLSAGLSQTLDRVRQTTDDDWAAHRADTQDAAARFDRLREAAAAGLANPAHAADRLADVRTLAEQASETFRSYASTAEQTRAADQRAMIDFQLAAARAATELRAAIADRHAVLARELERQGDLIDSAVALQNAQRALVGAKASATADQLRDRALTGTRPIADAAARLDAAIRVLHGSSEPRP